MGKGKPNLVRTRMISYAQNCEDVLLERVFLDRPSGLYIDIGAFDPVEGSVTKAFYDRGWSGINVEPSRMFHKLAAERLRDTNVKAAVVDYDGTIDFLEDPESLGMSRVAAGGNDASRGYHPFRVDAVTLETLLNRHAVGQEIDFLKIDAEGSEGAIVQSTNWEVIRPQVLVIEATHPWSSELSNQEWEPFLLRNQYLRAYFDGINVFYVRQENSEHLEHFKIPVNVLDNYVIYTTAREFASAECTELKHLCAALEGEVHELKTRLAQEQSASNELAVRASRYDRVVRDLRDDEASRTLRLGLAVARIIRRVRQAPKVPQASTPATPTFRTAVNWTQANPAMKAALQAVYRGLVRPIHPVMSRARVFFTQPIVDRLDQFGAVQEEQRHLAKSLEALLLTIASGRFTR